MSGWLWAVVPVAVGVVLGRLAAPASRSLSPRPATWTLTLSAVLTALCSTYALATIAAVAVGRIGDVAAVGGWAPRSLAGPATAPVALAVATTAALGALSVLAVVVSVRTAVALARVELHVRRDQARLVVVVPSADIDAYAVGGVTGGQIVVTTAMLGALTAGERAILMTHERAHLALRHHLFKVAVAIAATMNPLLRPVRTAVEASTERWADEYTATRTGNRRSVAEALTHAALATTAPAPCSSPASAFGRSALVVRVDALLNPRPGRSAHVIVAALLVAASLTATTAASRHTEALFEHAQRAYAATR